MSSRPRLSVVLGFVALVVVGLVYVITRPTAETLRGPDKNDSSRNPIEPASPGSAPTTHPLAGHHNHVDETGWQTMRAELQRRLSHANARSNEAVLTFTDAEAYARFLTRAQHRGLAVLGQLDALLSVRVRYESLDALMADLREHGHAVRDISANTFLRPPAPPTRDHRVITEGVPFRNDTLNYLGVPANHDTWGRGVRIAVLDSGVGSDATFEGGRVSYLDVGLGTLPGRGPADGHGTSVASLAAGLAPDAPGVAPGAGILSIRVTDTNGISDVFTVARAILAATDAGVSIINLSLGGYATAPALTAAITYATEHGAVIVAAGGNDQAAQLTWPAADPRVISVGAIDARSQQVTFSNSGPQLQIVAPGLGVQTAWSEGQRVYVDGTSASAPLVAGAIAAVISQNPSLNAAQAWSIIRQTTIEAGAPGADPDYGAGVLNLDWAMAFHDPTRIDPAIASHFYDVANQTMNVVVQNRSARPALNLALDVERGGTSQRYALPAISAGASYVVNLPVPANSLEEGGLLSFTTELVTPIGMDDANLSNNRLASKLAR